MDLSDENSMHVLIAFCAWRNLILRGEKGMSDLIEKCLGDSWSRDTKLRAYNMWISWATSKFNLFPPVSPLDWREGYDSTVYRQAHYQVLVSDWLSSDNPEAWNLNLDMLSGSLLEEEMARLRQSTLAIIPLAKDEVVESDQEEEITEEEYTMIDVEPGNYGSVQCLDFESLYPSVARSKPPRCWWKVVEVDMTKAAYFVLELGLSGEHIEALLRVGALSVR